MDCCWLEGAVSFGPHRAPAGLGPPWAAHPRMHLQKNVPEASRPVVGPHGSAVEQTARRGLFGLLLFAFVWVHQRFFGAPTPVSRLDVLCALVLHHQVCIDRYQTNTLDKAVWRGHFYSDKAPGAVALALPGLAAAKRAARKTTCLNNLKQLQLCWQLYVTDHDDAVPPNRSLMTNGVWRSTPDSGIGFGSAPHDTRAIEQGPLCRYDYNREVRIYHCPEDRSTVRGSTLPRTRSYSMNGAFGGRKEDRQPVVIQRAGEVRWGDARAVSVLQLGTVWQPVGNRLWPAPTDRFSRLAPAEVGPVSSLVCAGEPDPFAAAGAARRVRSAGPVAPLAFESLRHLADVCQPVSVSGLVGPWAGPVGPPGVVDGCGPDALAHARLPHHRLGAGRHLPVCPGFCAAVGGAGRAVSPGCACFGGRSRVGAGR